MNIIARITLILCFISGGINAIVFLGSVISLLEQYVGFLAYFLWIIITPIFLPAIIGLPWFVAWVENTEVSKLLFWLWLSMYLFMGMRAVLWKYAPDRPYFI